MNILEVYRPKSLNEFIGYKEIVRASKAWMEAWSKGKAFLPILILHGRSGVGKTTLAFCLGAEFNCSITEKNASDERNVGDMKRVLQETGLKSLEKGMRLTILDEADSLTQNAQQLLVSKITLVRSPLILLVNDMDKIVPELKKVSIKIEMRTPSKQDKRLLVARMLGEECEREGLEEIIDNSKSFRDLIYGVFLGKLDEDNLDDREGTTIELISSMLRGESGTERVRLDPNELLRYVYQNNMNWRLRDVDVWLKAARQTRQYSLWRYAFTIFELQRFEGAVHHPRNEFKSKKKPMKVVKRDKKKGGNVSISKKKMAKKEKKPTIGLLKFTV